MHDGCSYFKLQVWDKNQAMKCTTRIEEMLERFFKFE